MKTILVCSSDIMAIPAALKLKSDGFLSAIAIPAKHEERLLPSFLQVGFEREDIHMLTKERLADEMEALIRQYGAETVMVITFPWKIPDTVLNLPANGCINFHPGLLPKYMGSDPIFWQLRNEEKTIGVTVHRMTTVIDNGPVLMVEEMPQIPGETYGISMQRLALLMEGMVLKVIACIEEGKTIELESQEKALYKKMPTEEQLLIDWNGASASSIEALVNASNPKYNGALTTIRNRKVNILEVSPVELSNGPEDARPGSIVYADNLYGLVVACINKQFLKINIMCMNEGYLSGSKLFAMGFRNNEIFGL